MEKRIVYTYIAKDGEEFDNEKDCLNYEKEMCKKINDLKNLDFAFFFVYNYGIQEQRKNVTLEVIDKLKQEFFSINDEEFYNYFNLLEIYSMIGLQNLVTINDFSDNEFYPISDIKESEKERIEKEIFENGKCAMIFSPDSKWLFFGELDNIEKQFLHYFNQRDILKQENFLNILQEKYFDNKNKYDFEHNGNYDE